jgi:hypothetical protein
MAIDRHSNESQTKWDRGGYKAMIMSPTTSQPIGYCDGTPADEAELVEIAANEGTEIEIDKKTLKTGREIWTVRSLDERHEE